MFGKAPTCCAALALFGCISKDQITHPQWFVAGAGEARFAREAASE